MKTSLFLAVLLFITTGTIKAQDFGKNEFHVAYSDGFTLGAVNTFSNVLSTAIVDGFTGEKTKLTSESSFGMLEVGYKYQIGERFRLGLDIGYQKYNEKTVTEKTLKTVKREATFIVFMPNLNFSYIKTPLLDFYGSLGAGAVLTNEKVTESNNKKAATENQMDFAWQVNPVGLRVGKSLGGFAELGFGTKGFVTAGINYKF
ncbi:MAG: hypothetical protein ABI441_03020 [Flavobacterium sp.]